MNSHSERRSDAPLDLATTLFGPDPGDDEQLDPRILGKLWCKVRSGRDSDVEVRIGWIAGREYVQIAERLSGGNEYGPSILVGAEMLTDIADRITSLVRYRR